MTTLFKKRNSFQVQILVLFYAVSLLLTGCGKNNPEPKFELTTIASGLKSPMGIEAQGAGNIFVSESGTAHDDAKVVLVKPNGKVYDAIVNLSSIINKNSGETQGAGHLLLDGQFLYVLSGNYLYKVNVSALKPGDTPIDGSKLPFEDIGSFVLAYPFASHPNDTHPYNLTKGPDGDIYIADAGANAIIHRKAAGVYSVLAEIPGFANPTPVGPPQVQSVPTGILWDGDNFLVTTLTGFPFIAGKATVYKVTMAGSVSVYQPGFKTLVDIEEGSTYGHMLLQYGSFGPMGFVPNTGALIIANGTDSQVLTGTLNMPVGIKQVNNHTWYITSMGDGTVLKATYN